MTPPARPRGRRRLALALGSLGALALLFSLEGLASTALAWRDGAQRAGLTERSHCVYDPLLGWVNQPDVHVADLYGPGLHLTTDARGLRTHGAAAPPDAFRVVCLGDSFTLGHGVADDGTLPAFLAALAPNVDALNMGQGGYGVDQAYLWYRRDGADLDADLVLLTVIAPDFDRMLDARFQDTWPKPRLRVEDGALVLPDTDLPRDWERHATPRRLRGFGRELALARLARRVTRHLGGPPPAPSGPLPYRELAEAVLRDLQRLATERGARLALAHVPLRDRSVARAPEVVAWLRAFSGELGVPFVDLGRAFDELPPGEAAALYLPDGHLNRLGNRRVADVLLRELALR